MLGCMTMSLKYPAHFLVVLVGGMVLLILFYFGFFTASYKRAMRTDKEPLQDWRRSVRLTARRAVRGVRRALFSRTKDATGKAVVTVSLINNLI